MKVLLGRFRPWLPYLIALILVLASFWALERLFDPPRHAALFSKPVDLRIPGRDSPQETTPTWHIGALKQKNFMPGVYRAEMRLDLLPGQGSIEDWWLLVLPNISGNAVRALVDGVQIGSIGDFEEGRSNIWNSAKVFAIPPGHFSRESRFTIEILGVYEAGVTREPYMIERKKGASRVSLMLFLGEDGVLILAGAIAALGFLIAAIGLALRPRPNARMILGLAALCSALFLSDFAEIEYLALPLVEYKRAVVILRHVAAALFTLGYLRLLERRLDRFAKAFIPSQILSVLVLLVPQTMPSLKLVYSYSYLTVLPFQVYLFVLLLKEDADRTDIRMLLFGVSVGVLATLRDSLLDFFYPGAIYLSHFGFIVLMLSTAGFVIADILRHYRELVAEKERAERYREASLHDGLTGAYNRTALDLIAEGLTGQFGIVAVDLDDFKRINDRFGHSTGDRVLKDLVRLMNRAFRKDDFIARIGGDEFIAVLPHCPPERLNELCLRLREEIAAAFIPGIQAMSIHGNDDEEAGAPGQLAYGASLGYASWDGSAKPGLKEFSAILEMADRRLYEDKEMRAEHARRSV